MAMADPSANRTYPAVTKEEHVAPVVRELNEMIILERSLSSCKTNRERYHALLVIIDRELPYALNIPDPDPNGGPRSPKHLQWIDDMKEMRRILHDYQNIKPPVMPRPFPRPLLGRDPIVYQFYLPGNIHIGNIVAEDVPKVLPTLLEPEQERAYHEALGPWRSAKVSIRMVLDRYGIWTPKTEVALVLSSYTEGDIDRELQGAATAIASPRTEPEPAEEPHDFGFADEDDDSDEE